MTENEFFKMLNNIDDELIVGAKPAADAAEENADVEVNPSASDPAEMYGGSGRPVTIAPKRRPIWKTVMAAAACLMVIGAAIGVGIAVNKQRGKLPVDPGTVSSGSDPAGSDYSDNISNSGYPEDAIYKYEGDFSELKPEPYAIVDMEPPHNFFELAYGSDLIVVGTFVDDARQNQPLTGKLDMEGMTFRGRSFNKLRVDEVYKGNVVVGTEIVISDSYFVNDGKLMYISSYTSSPMIKGDKWVYFLNKGYEVYSSVMAYCGRSPVPGVENSALSDNVSGMPGDVMRYPDIKKMLEKDPSVLRMIRIDYDGKRYNTVGFMDLNGVHYLVGATKTQYEAGENIEVIGVVENNTDYTIGLYTMENSGGGCHGPVLTYISSGDLCLEDVDSVFQMTDWSHYTELVEPGTIYYQPMRFSTYQVDHFYSKFSDEYVPLGEYRCDAGIRFVEDPEIPDRGPQEYVPYGISFNIEVIDPVRETTERERVKYDGKTYIIISQGKFDGVTLKVGITKDQFEAGDDVEVIAIVENHTGNSIGLYTPNGSHGLAHEEVRTYLKNDDYYLTDASAAGLIVTCAESSYVLPSGATYSQPMRFSTYHERYSPEDTVIAEFVPLGIYKGTAGITLLSEPNNTSSHSERYSVNFEVEVVNTHDSYEFTMEEFPGVSFKCDGNVLTANGSELYRGTPIKNLYLIDLNGDGKRELCSTVYMEAQEEYRLVTDQRIMAYNYANGKLYELADRGQYDYRIEIEGGYEAPDTYQIYRVYAVKSKYSKYSTTNTYPIWRKELALDIMTGITEPNMKIKEFYKGVTEYKPGSTFYMGEFSLTRFDVSGSTIEMTRNGGTTENLFTSNDHIEKVYLADLNSDGRREIIVESYTRPLQSPAMTLGKPEKMLTYFDLENETGMNLWPPRTGADITLIYDDYSIHILYEGRRDPWVLSTGRFEQLGKNPDAWDLENWQEMF